MASALLERGHLIAKRALEGRPRLAARLICLQRRLGLHEVRVSQDPEHRRHHEVADGETVLQIIAIAEPGGELRQPPLTALSASGRWSFAHSWSA